jgi:hypothetical protein
MPALHKSWSVKLLSQAHFFLNVPIQFDDVLFGDKSEGSADQRKGTIYG